ncbi:ergothioneine biosynthesis protein EgtB [Larkinella soli]|uniref:ergothioneine biosynthesis protein EgtB n=1 Tax=Larkinella soli TaxID=1770527 RepID=UPI000FFC8B7A|nr:ergothioneine biosynthesis protein EgtB [Larkinella soli]
MIADPISATTPAGLSERYQEVRQYSEALCRPLTTEDYVVQPVIDVSPPKWHLGHTTWFWETFVLVPHRPGYRIFHDDFSFVFNSYYEAVGKRVLRADRGNLTRPTVEEVYRYRAYVDEQMHAFLESADLTPELHSLVELGLNHEQQHQELLLTDIKYILGHNPLFPGYHPPTPSLLRRGSDPHPASFGGLGSAGSAPFQGPGANHPLPSKEGAGGWSEGIYTIGYRGDGFHFDNEKGVHKVYLQAFDLERSLVTNGEYLEFVESGGYRQFRYWLADGWAWVNENRIEAPLYWHRIDGQWWHYTFDGLKPVDPDEPVCHVSFYEADAFARRRGRRLPTEFEWEAAATTGGFDWGRLWEWTNSAYLPYPGFQTAEGAVGEYNGKFMINQMVLRGGSVATPAGHSRPTYRNFFQPDKRWQFTGIRLVKK